MALMASGTQRVEEAYVFFDDIQYLKDWEGHLKVLADRYPDTTFVASGPLRPLYPSRERNVGGTTTTTE